MAGGWALTVHSCGWYEGRGRRESPSVKTRRLLASKYHRNPDARAEMILEMSALARTLRCDFLTYALARDSSIQHARILALLPYGFMTDG